MKTNRYPALLAIILAFVITFFAPDVSYAARAKAQKAPTYNAAQLEQIQLYTPTLSKFSERITQIESLIEAEKWTDIRTLIHGPLGELRRTTNRILQNLLGPDRKAAEAAETALFKHLVDLDVAASEQNYDLCVKSYNAAINDLEKFVSIIPQSAA